MSNQTLRHATRRELIDELTRRESITGYHVIQSNEAIIKTTNGSIAVEGDAYIFVIKPEIEQAAASEDSSTPNSMPYKDITDWSIFFK